MATCKSVVDGDPEGEGMQNNGAGRNWGCNCYVHYPGTGDGFTSKCMSKFIKLYILNI